MENETPNSDKVVSREELLDDNGKFKVGHPKVGGAIKGKKQFTTIVEEALWKIGTTEAGDKIEIERALGEKVVAMALAGNEQMIKLIWNYRDGMPKASLELDDKRVDETKEKLKELLDKLNESIK